MKYLLILILLYVPSKSERFVTKYKAIAEQEALITCQPASVKLAQAIHESGYGESPVAKATNNLFGIRCFAKSCTPGHCYGSKKYVIFPSVEAGFKAHSKVILQTRYDECRTMSDPMDWCDCLQRKHYASDKRYSFLLKNLLRTSKHL